MKAHNRNKDKTGLCFLLLCAVSLVCSCSREDDLSVDSEPVEAAFSGSFVREEWSDSGRDDSCRAGTRVSDDKWTVGDAVGVYMVPSGSYDLAGAVWKNRKQVIDSNNKMIPDGSANKLYYPVNGSAVRFVAYYPYATSPTHPDSLNTVSVDFSDQSTKAKKEAKDFVFHRGATDYSKAYPNASLGFSHKFSKIRMTVTKGDGGPSLSGLAVTLKGMPKSATVYLDRLSQRRADTDADSIAVGEAGDIAAFTLSSSNETATVEAIVAPHTGTGNFAGRTFTFTAGGETKSYDLPDTVTFKSGYAYHFTFSLVSGTTPQLPTQVSDGMTNCYMVVPGGNVSFKVSRAYTYVNNAFTNTLRVDEQNEYTGAFTAEVLWEDADVINDTLTVMSGSGNTAMVNVQTNSVSGNAVVAIRKDNGDIVWSYHIWVTDYDATDPSKWYTNTYNTNNNGKNFVFMDRNLGATKTGRPTSTSTGANAGFGLFYQWGRKDPFPATLNPGVTQPGRGTFTVTTTDETKGTIVYTLKNPSTFLTTRGGADDWHYASRDNELWDHSDVKTIYDPCPSGWRVPKNSGMSEATSPWYGFSSSNGTWSYGYDWGDNAEYPAAGYRRYGYGSVDGVGSFARYWSASPHYDSSNNASGLYFSSGNVFVNYGYYRADGIGVRCAQE